MVGDRMNKFEKLANEIIDDVNFRNKFTKRELKELNER